MSDKPAEAVEELHSAALMRNQLASEWRGRIGYLLLELSPEQVAQCRHSHLKALEIQGKGQRKPAETDLHCPTPMDKVAAGCF